MARRRHYQKSRNTNDYPINQTRQPQSVGFFRWYYPKNKWSYFTVAFLITLISGFYVTALLVLILAFVIRGITATQDTHGRQASPPIAMKQPRLINRDGRVKERLEVSYISRAAKTIQITKNCVACGAQLMPSGGYCNNCGTLAPQS